MADGGVRLNVEMIQLIGVELELRFRFKNHVILVELRVHRIDLALTKSIVEGVVDGGRGHAESRSSGSVDHQGHREAAHLLVGRNIFELRQFFEASDKAIGPVVELILIWIFKRVLKLRPTHAVVHSDVLHRLHKNLDVLQVS